MVRGSEVSFTNSKLYIYCVTSKFLERPFRGNEMRKKRRKIEAKNLFAIEPIASGYIFFFYWKNLLFKKSIKEKFLKIVASSRYIIKKSYENGNNM